MVKIQTRVLGIVVVGIMLTGCGQNKGTEGQPNVLPVAKEEIGQTVTVVIDDGVTVATHSAVLGEGATVLEALNQLKNEGKVDYQVIHYDFGDLVTTIGGKENDEDKAWIYFVNGVAGNVGAGEKILAVGDEVMWRYTKPSY